MGKKDKKRKNDKNNQKNMKLLLKAVIAFLSLFAVGKISIEIYTKTIDTNVHSGESEIIDISQDKIENNGDNSGVFIQQMIGDINIDNSNTMHDARIQLYELGPVSYANYNNVLEYQVFKQQSDYSDTDKIYYYNNDFMSMVAISNNNSNKEIILNNFKLVAENITVDTTPYISMYCTQDENYDPAYLFNSYIRNEGWGDANNLEIFFEDENDFLNKLFEKKDLILSMETVKYGTIQSINCIDLNAMDWEKYYELINIYGQFSLGISVYAKSDECDFGEVEYIALICSADGIQALGGGIGGDMAYAIIIDTDNDNFVLDVKIDENIPAGSILELPICFFPDKSCSFSYYVAFEVYDGFKSYTIETESRNIKFFVSSCYDYVDFKNISNMVSGEGTHYFASYPYATLKRVDETGEYYIIDPRQQ